MEHNNLSSLIAALERGTKLHICVTFLEGHGNHMTRCTHDQAVHETPVCLAVKSSRDGLSDCYRCRMTVQRAVIRRRKPMGGYCTKGVYEYCRPVIYEDRVIALVFVGNVLTGDPAQRERLVSHVGAELLETMERQIAPKDCAETADIVAGYILFLMAHYGSVHSREYDPLVENVKNFIRENIDYNVTVNELGKLFGYNPKYLGRQFSLREGCTIRWFCNKIKVTKAKELLAQTELSVDEVAHRVGFDYVNYFDRVFLQHTRITPRAYRTAAKQKAANR